MFFYQSVTQTLHNSIQVSQEGGQHTHRGLGGQDGQDFKKKQL